MDKREQARDWYDDVLEAWVPAMRAQREAWREYRHSWDTHGYGSERAQSLRREWKRAANETDALTAQLDLAHWAMETLAAN